MSVVISGTLIDGAGIPMSGCHIILKSRVNTSEVVMRSVADVVAGNCGEYCFKAQTGKYCVYLKQDWRDEYCVGDIAVYDDSKPGTLNDFLTALDEDDLKPDVVKRFEEMVAQAQQSAEAAAGSAQEAGKHAAGIEGAKERVETLFVEVKQNADAVAKDKLRVEMLASQIEDTASEVRQDAEAAKKAASDAEQARDEIDTALSATLKTANHLSEIAAEGKEAQQESRDNLGLKSAAMMEPQSDIHDRTEGRLAIPGAFGFGYIFKEDEVVRFNSENDFLVWAGQATPGEYFVDGGNKTIPGNVLFRGMVYIRWVESRYGQPEPAYTAKAITFYGINGDIYYNRYWHATKGYLIGWENLKVNEASLRALIETCAPLNSPILTGTPKTPTPPDDAAGTEIANAAFVRKLLAALVDSSPEALDTLNELAAALGNDPEFATTITNALAGKQPLNAVLTALSNLTQRAGTLAYFNADEDVSLAPLSEKGRSLLAQETPEAMRTVLELTSAATMEPQSGIYDFTEGRLAIPGAYGYGGIPGGCKYFDAYRGPSEFEAWVQATPPGRYFVTQSGGTGMNNIIPDGIYFRGMVEILPARSGYSIDNHTESDKLVIFYGDEGAIYTSCFNPRFNPGQRLKGWVNAIFRDVDVGYVLKSCGATYIGYNPPAPGGLILAAYCGGSDRKIWRNLSVSGSQLALVSVIAPANDTVSTLQVAVDTRSMTSNTMPGLYYSLSGSPFITCDEDMVMVGLFVRVA
ncbi:TPA: prophage tail fiber N-terminal domain-containing protein [Escherichia coli]